MAWTRSERVSMTEQNPYTPHVAFAMDEFKARAARARREAAKLITQAEIWEEAAIQLDIAIGKEKRDAVGKESAP